MKHRFLLSVVVVLVVITAAVLPVGVNPKSVTANTTVSTSTGSGWYRESFATAWNGKVRHGGAGGFRAKLNTVRYWTGGTVPWLNNQFMRFHLSYTQVSGRAVLTVTGVLPGFDPVTLSDCVSVGAGRVLLTGKTSREDVGRVVLSNVMVNGVPVGSPSGFEATGRNGARDIRWFLIAGLRGDFSLEGDLLFAWGCNAIDEGPALEFAVEPPASRPRWDVNGDGIVDIGDIVVIGIYWGQSGAPGWVSADVNGDGVVDIGDVVIIGLHWGGTY